MQYNSYYQLSRPFAYRRGIVHPLRAPWLRASHRCQNASTWRLRSSASPTGALPWTPLGGFRVPSPDPYRQSQQNSSNSADLLVVGAVARTVAEAADDVLLRGDAASHRRLLAHARSNPRHNQHTPLLVIRNAVINCNCNCN